MLHIAALTLTTAYVSESQINEMLELCFILQQKYNNKLVTWNFWSKRASC